MSIRVSTVIALSTVLVFGLAACQKTESTAEGPAEKVGQQLDQAASKAAVHINAIAEKAGQGLSKAGDQIEETAKEARENNAEQKNDAAK